MYNTAQDAFNQMQQISAANNAWSAAQADKQMDFQRESNQRAMDFNAEQAALNRDWQKMMSDTAHQREVRDMLAAGINPILSVNGGNGAAVTSGATASGVSSQGSKGDTDMSLNGALVSLLNNVLQQKNQMDIANLNAQTNLAVADKYNAMSEMLGKLQNQLGYANLDLSRYLGELSAMTSTNIAGISSSATRYAADASASAYRYATDVQSRTSAMVAQINKQSNQVSATIHAQATRYASDVQAAASRYASDNSTSNARYLQECEQRFQEYIKKYYPSNVWNAMGASAGLIDDIIARAIGAPNRFDWYFN